jgi:hypothetical protein
MNSQESPCPAGEALRDMGFPEEIFRIDLSYDYYPIMVTWRGYLYEKICIYAVGLSFDVRDFSC